jgi:hypothetical protein
LTKVNGHRLYLQLGPREKRLLVEVLQLYPLVDAAYPRATRSADPRVDQKLLAEALAELRKENKQRLDVFLAEPQRFTDTKESSSLMIEFQNVEWLLQVLNDIRVGSWLKLGMPDEKSGKNWLLNLGNLRYVIAMELCGLMEAILLEAGSQRPAT